MIDIQQINDTLFEVTVTDRSTTKHQVTISDEYHLKLTSGKISKEALLNQSFEFLLQRESNTMIMSRFDLPVISRYFPEYENEIRRRAQ
ncbi:MAG: hypothetical protein KQI35_05185 [Bacteroidetes bacterium]|nr:hypothetical protein [Bacteroidota bacterium]